MPKLLIILRSRPYMATPLLVAFAKKLMHPYYGGTRGACMDDTFQFAQVKAWVPGKERMS